MMLRRRCHPRCHPSILEVGCCCCCPLQLSSSSKVDFRWWWRWRWPARPSVRLVREEGKRARKDGEDQSRLRGDKPAKRKQTVTQSIKNWITTNALSTYLKGKSPGCWGAGGSERGREEDEEDDEGDEGDPREEDGWSWRLSQPMSSVMSSAAGAGHAVNKQRQRAESPTRLLSSASTRQVRSRHSSGKSEQHCTVYITTVTHSLLTAVRGARRRCNARYRNGNFKCQYLGKYSSNQSFACAGTLY